jgi:hypothetical protein
MRTIATMFAVLLSTIAHAQPVPTAPIPLPVTNAECWERYQLDFLREYQRHLDGDIDVERLLQIIDNLQRRLDECLALPDNQTPCTGCTPGATCDECFNAGATCAWRDYIDGITTGDELDGQMKSLRNRLSLCANIPGLIPAAVFGGAWD